MISLDSYPLRQIDGGFNETNGQQSRCSGFRDTPHMNGGTVRVNSFLQAFQERALVGSTQVSKPGATTQFRALTNNSSRRQKASWRFAVKFGGGAA